jgi:predicted permease
VHKLWKDLCSSWRTLRKSPGFTAIAIATLAIGIGANTAIFSFVDSVLLKPLPYPDADRIVRVLEKPPGGGHNGISTLNYLDWAKDNTVFQYMAAQTGDSFTLTGITEPVQLRGSRVSASYFDIFGIQPMLGRTFAAGEDERGKDHVAVLSYSLWQSQFGGDPKIIGRSILLDGEPTTVIGILPATSAFNRAYAQIWRPLAFAPSNMTRNFHWFGAMAKLKPGVTLEQARAQMDTIGARIAHDFPDSNKGWGVVVERMSEVLIGSGMRRSLYTLLTAVGMVLLIGCVNLANLTLSRATAREREVAIRMSLGAGRWRLVRQFLTESAVLAAAGGALGIAVGYVTMVVLKNALPPFSFPREVDIALDGRVLLFAVALCGFTSILFGLAPALHATRPDLGAAMKEGGLGAGTSGGRRRMREVLVVGEVALAFMLLTAAGLIMRSFFSIQHQDPGFDSTNVITAGLPTADDRFPNNEARNNFFRQVVANLEALPGVRSVALTSALPLRGWGYGMPFQIAGRPTVDRANRKACFFKMVTPSYFRTVGIRIRKGRALSDRDRAGTPPVTVINETMARKYFPNQDPLGQRILIQEIVPGKTALGPEIPWEVVGVAGDERVTSMDDKDDSPGVYISTEQSTANYYSVAVRTAMDPTSLTPAIRNAVHRVDKDQTLTDIKTLDQIKDEDMVTERIQTTLLGVFAAIALLLAALGIYGVISYSVLQRTREIGIRGALGATSRDVLRLVLRGGMLMSGIGLLIGFAGALAAMQLLRVMLFGVQARDPITLAAVSAILAVVALTACFIPARRASKVDPVVALRYE